jgi:hypothetical protein
MVRIVIALVLAAHGIGHIMGVVQAVHVTTVNPSWDGRSWLLSDTAGATLTEAIGVVLWSMALVGFVVLAGVVMGWLPEGWWAPMALVASVASIAGIVLFPTAFPTVSTLGALAVDIVVLAATFWWHWVPADPGS